jgi:FKBP-type peptidyl-prolyl cis-trans isomerase SlpA
VGPQSFVTLHYRIRLQSNQQVVVSTFEEQPATVHLGQGQLSEGLERCLLGMQVGHRDVFMLAAEQAYGPSNPTLFRPVTLALLEKESGESTYEPGECVYFPAPDGGKFVGTVVEHQGSHVLFDFNHPLAGKPLVFEAQIIGVL